MSPRRNTKGMGCYDSIQPSKAETDLFNTIRHYQTPHDNPSRFARKQEIDQSILTIPMQKKLEIEAQEKFQTGDYQLASGQVIPKLGKIAKYLFLAFMLPCYLCFYSFPCWLALKMLPKIADAASKHLDIISAVVRKIVGWLKSTLVIVADTIKVLKQAKLKKSNREGVGAKKLVLLIFRLFPLLLQASLKTLQFLTDSVKMMIARAKSLWHRFEVQVTIFFKKVGHKLKHSLKKTFLLVASPFIFLGDLFYNALIRQPINSFQRRFNQIKRGVLFTVQFFKILYRFFRNPIATISGTGRQFYSWVASGITGLLTPPTQRLVHHGKVICRYIKTKWQLLRAHLMYVRSQLPYYYMRSLKYARQALLQFIVNLQRLPEITAMYAPKWLMWTLAFVKHYCDCLVGVVLGIAAWFNAKIKIITEKCAVVISPLIKGIRHHLFPFFAENSRFLTKTFHWCLKVLRRLLQAFNRAWTITTYRLCVSLAWAKVLLRYGMELVRESASQLSK